MSKSNLTTAEAAALSRRGFLITGGAAATGGLAIGFNIAGIGDALAQKVLGAAGNEVGAGLILSRTTKSLSASRARKWVKAH